MNALLAIFGYKITVEPVLFVFMYTVFMNIPAAQDLIYTKVCIDEYSDTVCNNLYDKNNRDALDAVQTGSSHWILGSTLMMAVPSILVAQFLGSWSDLYGRKIPLLFPPLGGLLASIVYISISIYLKESHVSYVLLASFNAGLCGGFTSCILTCMSYMSQMTTKKERSWRISLLESMIFFGGAFGTLSCGWITALGGRVAVFSVNLVCHFLILVYIVIFIRDLPPRHLPQDPWYKTAFSCGHILDSLTTLLRRREYNKRSYLLRLIITAAAVMFITAGELDVMFLYLRDAPIQMNLLHYTYFFALKFAIGGVSIIILKWIAPKLPDSVLLLVGLGFKISMLLYMSWVLSTTTAFIGPLIGFASSWCLPIIRSSMSKLVDYQEQGKMFACIALIENACTLVASGVFNSIYPALRHIRHGFIFLLSAFFLIIPVILTMTLHSTLKNLSREEGSESTQDREPVKQATRPPPNVSDSPAPSTPPVTRERNASISTTSSTLSLAGNDNSV